MIFELPRHDNMWSIIRGQAFARIMEKKKALEFLRGQKLAVVATVSCRSKSPESALIAFCEDENLNIYFQSMRGTRKSENIAINPNVSFVFGLDMGLVTMQYEGRAGVIESAEDLDACREMFINKKSPTTAKYFNDKTIFYKVKPMWIGFSDYSRATPDVSEIRFE